MASELTKMISKLNKRIRRMATSDVQSQAFVGLQHRLSKNEFKGKKREKRGGKEFFTFSQKNLTGKQKELLEREVFAYENKPTLREVKQERKSKAQDLADFFNKYQQDVGSKRRINKPTEKQVDKLWRIYNQYYKNNSKMQDDIGSDQIIDAIKVNITKSQKDIIELINKMYENDEQLVSDELIAEERKRREERAKKKGVKF